MRHIKVKFICALLALSVLSSGCLTEGVDFLLTALTGGAVPTVPKGDSVVVGSLFRFVVTNIPPGKAIVSGKAFNPGTNQAGLISSALPTQLQFRVQHKNKKGKGGRQKKVPKNPPHKGNVSQ